MSHCSPRLQGQSSVLVSTAFLAHSPPGTAEAEHPLPLR